jgi:hypothetical protein
MKDRMLGRKGAVIVVIAVCFAVAFLWSRSGSFFGSNPDQGSGPTTVASAPVVPAGSARVSDSTKTAGQRVQPIANKPARIEGRPWRQLTVTKAELAAHPNYWMLAYSESDMAWLDRHGYPSLEEEAMLSQATIEALQARVQAGDLNAGIHLALRFAKNALTSGDPRQFVAARREFDRALIEGGPYQSAKTVAFFTELANSQSGYGALDAATLKGLENDLLTFYTMARGLSAAFGDFGAMQVGNGPFSHDVGRVFGLPPANSDISLEVAMRRFSNINTSRMRRGLPPFDLTQRPGDPGLGLNATYTVYSR